MSDLFAISLTLIVCSSLLIIFSRAIRCKHSWKVIKQGETLARSGPEFGEPNGYYYISQCEKCGKIKREDF